jgi:hypothetical protein
VSSGCCQITVGVCACIPQDFDHDCDVDLDDYTAFRDCFSGPMVHDAPGCEAKDLDGDNDVDMLDFGLFQRCYTGAGQPVVAGCGG